jgi:hypothetical protein
MREKLQQSESAKAEREKRLAEALRANLKRRKAQARERSAADGAPSQDLVSGKREAD